VAVGGDPGPESDIFSLGSTLYAACEGQPPFGLSENTLGLLHAVAAGQINPPRQSGPLASVLAVLLHPEVQHRPTAAECEGLLNAVAHGEAPLGGPDERTQLAAGMFGGAAATRAISPDATRAVDPAANFYDDYEDDYEDGYGATAAYPVNDRDATRAAQRGYDDYPDDGEENGQRGKWKVPAIIAAVAAIALVGLVIWLFSPNKTGTTTTPTPNPGAVPPPATSSSSLQPTETSTATVTASQETTVQRTTRRSTVNTDTSTTEAPTSSSSKHSTASSSSSKPPSSPSETSTTG